MTEMKERGGGACVQRQIMENLRGKIKEVRGTVSEGAAGHLFLPGTVLQCDPALRFKSCDGGFAGHSGIPGKL